MSHTGRTLADAGGALQHFTRTLGDATVVVVALTDGGWVIRPRGTGVFCKLLATASPANELASENCHGWIEDGSERFLRVPPGTWNLHVVRDAAASCTLHFDKVAPVTA